MRATWSAPARTLPGLSPAYVLIVEDEMLIGNLLREQLEDEGYAVEVARSIAEGRSYIRARQPGLVLLDLMLPGEDGWTFLLARRVDPVLARVPVVAISAAPHSRLLEARDLGADAILGKPFDLAAVSEVVHRFIAAGAAVPVSAAR